MVSSLEEEKRDADQRFLRAVTWMPVCSKGGYSSGRLGSTSQSPHRIPVTQVLRRLKKYYLSKNSLNLIIKLSPFFAKHLLKDFRTYRVRFCKMLFVTVMWPINLFCFGEDLKLNVFKLQQLAEPVRRKASVRLRTAVPVSHTKSVGVPECLEG